MISIYDVLITIKFIIPLIFIVGLFLLLGKTLAFLAPYFPIILGVVFFIPTLRGFRILFTRFKDFGGSIIRFRQRYQASKENN